MNGWYSASNVTGDKADILSLQTGSRHYFQRPGFKILKRRQQCYIFDRQCRQNSVK